ncbi:hypothetical protein [Dysgonomonas capnocytophagoides]|uniref:hypothetical protein n=1 Tax=Dysgonomonas capnocytophagoides TaxID=45254 RepID=UPI0033424082
MAIDRFKQYQYALVRFFRSRGYNVDSQKKTIRIDPIELNSKDHERLKKLEAWGFTVQNPSVRNRRVDYTMIDDYDTDNYESESFLDFADEIIWMYKNGL